MGRGPASAEDLMLAIFHHFRCCEVVPPWTSRGFTVRGTEEGLTNARPLPVLCNKIQQSSVLKPSSCGQILSLPSLSPSLIASSYTPAPRGISHCLYPPFCSRSPWHTWNSITTAQGEGVASLWGPDTKCLFLSFRMTLPAPPLSGDNDLIISFLAKILLCSPDPKRS
nr:uncharacterized protein LOC110359662 isoform X2 [Columba livia]